jgi:hypothetical protein
MSNAEAAQALGVAVSRCPSGGASSPPSAPVPVEPATSSPDLGLVASRLGWLGGSAADLLADKDDVDAAAQLLMHLQDLPDLAALPVGGLRARLPAAGCAG